jgi:hypothetical protein
MQRRRLPRLLAGLVAETRLTARHCSWPRILTSIRRGRPRPVQIVETFKAARAGVPGAGFWPGPIMMHYQPVFARVSLSEQARASALSGDFSSPTVAQPAFITMSLREYDDVSDRNLSNMVLSGSCWAFATQNGTSAATTAISARSWASFSAVDDVVHPSCEKPTEAITIAPATAPQAPGFSQTGICIGCSFRCGRTDLLAPARSILVNMVGCIAITSPRRN